ncbi:hypothetical protein AAG906_019368 [Vitis piasezkii]
MTRAFRKRVKPRKFQRGDLVLKVLRGLISDPRGKFRPSWSGPYVIEIRLEKEVPVDALDRNHTSPLWAWCHSSLVLSCIIACFLSPFCIFTPPTVSPLSIISIHFAAFLSRMRALYDPSHHGSGRHIGSEDELFVVVTYCYICIPVGFSIFFYTHSSFILSLFVCFYPRRSSFHFMNDEFFGVWHYLLGDLGLCFPSFHSPFTPGLHYGPSRKTTLRP